MNLSKRGERMDKQWFQTIGRGHERRFIAALVAAKQIAKVNRLTLGEKEIGNIMKLMNSVDLTENVVSGTYHRARKKKRA